MTTTTEAAAIQNADNERRAQDIVTAIEVQLTDAGHTVDFSRRELGCRSFINEVDGIYVGLAARPQGGNAYTKKAPTRLRLSFGTRMHTVKQFPEPKLGFNVAKITEAVIEYVESEKARKASEAKGQEAFALNQGLADKINAEFGVSRYAGTAIQATTYGLKIVANSTVTESQARAIMAILAPAPAAIPASEFYDALPRVP